MKATIHPKWFSEAKVSCACGNSFTVGSTIENLSVDICYNCHPFYTGNLKLADTGGRVQAFRQKQELASKTIVSKIQKRKLKKERKIALELSKPESLEALRKSTDKSSN